MTSRSRTWVLALTSVASLMVALDVLVVSTALKAIRIDLGASLQELGWTVNAYNLSFAVFLITAAALADRWGRRRTFAAGLAVFSLASAACALAPSGAWLIAARAAQGVGAAVIMAVAVALIGAAFPPARLGRALGIFSGITGLATLAGPLVGGAVTQAIGWEWIFWLNVPIGLLAIPLVFARIDESFGTNSALDLPGVALVTLAVLGLVWGLVRGTSAGWASPEVAVALAGGIVLGAAFVAWELRAPHPMLPMRLFLNRAFSAGNAITFVLVGEVFGSAFLMAQFLQTDLGSSPLESGLQMIPWTGTMMFIAPLAGWLADRYGPRPVSALGLAFATVGWAWLAVIAHPGMPYAEVALPLLICGIGNSAAIPVVQAGVLASVGPAAAGIAAGTNVMLRQLGGVFGIAILTTVFASTGSYASAQAFNAGFSPAIGACASLALVGLLISLVPAPNHGATETSSPTTHHRPAEERSVP